MKPVLCAPTGRAAKKMTEATGNEASTLHRLLEIGKISDETQGINSDISVAPIDVDIVIVDEMSMVDLFLMNYLCKALYKGTKLVLVGDIDQLPSVGPGNVLKDIIESEKITTIRLNKIFRQAAKSKIIVNAHRVNEGKGFITKEEINNFENEETTQENKNGGFLEDFFFVNETKKDKIFHGLGLWRVNQIIKKNENFIFVIPATIHSASSGNIGKVNTIGSNNLLFESIKS